MNFRQAKKIVKKYVQDIWLYPDRITFTYNLNELCKSKVNRGTLEAARNRVIRHIHKYGLENSKLGILKNKKLMTGKI